MRFNKKAFDEVLLKVEQVLLAPAFHEEALVCCVDCLPSRKGRLAHHQ